ncbi:MAG: NAD-dependent epimerase/dehydratase family protein [Sphingobacterium sp.]|uniref:NAD-dependent epimerase/dehydratase family protein n=1 Tax=Sphingobacterium sp. JB170 TaxID=1434842 RepID=UPI00097F2395|nr:NAD-dependent epimerase/dehydratase family protein [Sphingobacterium sp. JB170]SJN23191.1 Nucleoside-diphosphate-sugar epimerases [Sphingobacterium sp. JB170]
MQTILGAGGDIGSLLAKELKQFSEKIRLVARYPSQVNGNDELVSADLLDPDAVSEAVRDSKIVYLTVGLKYDFRIWQSQWPAIIRNVVDACVLHGSKLVFFDNVYMYDKGAIPNMTEDSPMAPPSKKGTVRLEVVRHIMEAMATRNLKALIARSADFYGPASKNGILNILVLNAAAKGKKMSWQADPYKVHSFTYTPDAAKATAMLGNTESAFGQVWHLPTSSERLTGHQLIELASGLKMRKASYRVLTPFILSLGGLFDRSIRELKEMQYQNDRDYFFNSDKFCTAFAFTPTSYRDGITETLKREYQSLNQ